MVKGIILWLTCSLPFLGFAQIHFEKGYFIDQEGNRVECLIKNMDWNRTPKQFEFKLTPEGQVQKSDASSVREFGIDNVSKYVKKQLRIDRSGDRLDTLSTTRAPLWSEEQVILKVLVEGKGSLFLYQAGNVARFFYEVNGSPIQQLVYKKYAIDGDFMHIGVNNDFRQQLWAEVNCGQSPQNSMRNLTCDAYTLIKYFRKYNNCIGRVTGTDVEGKDHVLTPRSTFNVRIKAGFDLMSVTVGEPSYSYIDHDMGTAGEFRLGAEGEFVLPFNKAAWSLFLEPTYQHFSGYNGSIEIIYHAVEFPLGLRRYFFLEDDGKVFLNGCLVPVFPVNSRVSVPGFVSSVGGAGANLNLALGVGWMNKGFSAEVRYYSRRKIFNEYNVRTELTDFAMIVGFKLF
jgi:hypothetical protein